MRLRSLGRVIVLLTLLSLSNGFAKGVYSQPADLGQDPLEWLNEPHSVFSSEIKMSVKVPDLSGDLEYRFECFEGEGYSSDWQKSNEFKNSDLEPNTEYGYVAHVRMAGQSDIVLSSTQEYQVTTRRSTNFGRSRYMPEIDEAFKNGEIELIPIRVTGDKDNRINFCAINRWEEGKPNSYNTPELREEFIDDAKHAFRVFNPGDEYAIAPYPEYRDFFNLYAIWWAGMPAYNWQKGLTTVDLDEIRDRLFLPWNKEGKGWVSCLAMLNSDYGGGGAARNIETRTGNAMIAGRETEGFIHEFSHTAPGLPDEYTANGVWGKGGEGSNTTLDYIPEDVKWRAWIEPGTEIPTPYTPENMGKIGVFEGATHRLHHIYRPTARGCIMGAGSFSGDPDGLCPICIQRTVCRLYMWVDPFDEVYPARKVFEVGSPGKVQFSVNQIENLSGSQELSWYLNGAEIASDVSEVEVQLDKNKEYVIECRLVDKTEFVRPDLPFVDFPAASVKWFVNREAEIPVPAKDILRNPDNISLETKFEIPEDTKGAGTLSARAIINNPSSGNMNNGSVYILASQGKKPYTYYWSDGVKTDDHTRDFLKPAKYTVAVIDTDGFMTKVDFEIEKAPAYEIGGLEFKRTRKGKIRIKNQQKGYSYNWYPEDIPNYVPKFPNGKYYGSGKTTDGEEFKAVATVVENRGGIFIRDTAKNDFGSWIYLKVFKNGPNDLPVEFEINTTQNGRFADVLNIANHKTEKITYNDNYQFSTELVDITWNGVIRDGYLELSEEGFLDSKMKLWYSSAYADPKPGIGFWSTLDPKEPGNYYVEASTWDKGTRSINRIGVAIPPDIKRKKVKPINPDAIESAMLIMWLDGNDLNADGKPDGKLFRRGSANGGKSKVGDIGFHFFNYLPNAQNGKPSLSFSTIWVQGLTKPVNNYQTIIMVRKENKFSSERTAPWRELKSLIGTGKYGEKLFADDLSESISNGNVWINGEEVDIKLATMPKDYYIATYEFSEVLDNPFKITDGHWEGEIAEVLVFDSKLSEKDRKGVEEYLFNKWLSGISK